MKKDLLNIILIDDNESMNFLNKMVIDNGKCAKSLLSFDCAQKALDHIDSCLDLPENYPDLIFLDIHMPGLNGWEFLDAFESISERVDRRPIVIMISTSMNPNDLEKQANYQLIKAFHTKPLSNEILSLVLSSYFDHLDDQNAPQDAGNLER